MNQDPKEMEVATLQYTNVYVETMKPEETKGKPLAKNSSSTQKNGKFKDSSNSDNTGDELD